MTNTSRGLPWRRCGCGKRSYPDRKTARRAARAWHPGQRMQAYTCRVGSGFHIGHCRHPEGRDHYRAVE